MSPTHFLLGTSLVLLTACTMRERGSESFADEPSGTVASAGAGDAEMSSEQTASGKDEDSTSPTSDTSAATRQSVVSASAAVSGTEGDDVVTAGVRERRQDAGPSVSLDAEPRAELKARDRYADSDEVAAPARPGRSSISEKRKSASGSGSIAAHAPVTSTPVGGLLGPSGAQYYPPAPADPPTEAVSMYGGSEQYTDHGVNPFTMVRDDAQSTFSIDVDTASFTIARKKLDAGVLPPPEAVRVEEFVNYLDYGYRAPTDGSPFSVHMAAMPDPFRDGQHILRVGVQGKEVSRDERSPVHLTFLVDVSGSMSSADKLGLAKDSLHMMVDSLREDDTVALATYAGRVAKILEPTSAANKRQIHDAIEGLNSGGSTAMSSGIDLAYGMAWDSFEPGHENRVIVLSDGDANVGKTSWDDMLTQVKGYADRGVTLSTIGFGMGNYKDTLMEQLSNKGDGNNYYIDDQAQAQRVFVDDLGGTLVTIARDTKIQVEFNPESVLAYRLIGYENRDIADRDFRNDKVDAGEVGAGHNVTALYSVILKDGYTRDLATVRLRWEQPGADVDHGGSGATERAYGFKDRALAERVDFATKDLRIAYASATFAEILRHSPEAEELSMDALISFAKSARRAGEQDDIELVELMEKARSLGAGTSSGAVTSR